MWAEPIADVTDIQAIWDYAITVDGYDYSMLELQRECGDLANERLSVFEKTGIWEGSLLLLAWTQVGPRIEDVVRTSLQKIKKSVDDC